MARKYIRTTMGVFIEEDGAEGRGRKPGKCPQCNKPQERQPGHCQNVSELMELANTVVEARTDRDDATPMTVDIRVACGLLRAGYRKPRH